MIILPFLILLVSFFSNPVMALPLSKEQIFQVATLAARDGEYEKAAEFFKKVLEIDPRFGPAYNSLGMVYQAMGGDSSSSEAMRYYRLAVQVSPDYVEALNNLGRASYSVGEFEQAGQALSHSLELRPEQPDIDLMLGWVYLLGQSRAELAIKSFERGLLSLNDDMAHYGLGLAHLVLDEKFKVFDQITQLRKRGKEELASRLENMVRSKVKISSTLGEPLVTGVDRGVSIFDQELRALTANGFRAGNDAKGIQVRLKGPLAE